MDWLGKELNIKSWEDWYKVKASDVQEKGGASLLTTYHNNSLSKSLAAVSFYKRYQKIRYVRITYEIYPEHPWLIWKFEKVPQGFWDNIEHQRDFLKWMEKERNIQTPEDWYKIRLNDFRDLGGSSLVLKYGHSYIKCLQTV
jgi:hypothetical protein